MTSTRPCDMKLINLCMFTFAVALIVLTSSSNGLIFLPKFTTRFCYNSPNATVTSQCVYCAYFQWDSTVLGCTGSTAVTVNMTSTNAFCIISQCLGQVKQTPIFLGRRRRDIDEDDVDADASLRSTDEDANIGDSYQSVETVEFIIHGKPERYIVANEVNVDINEPGDNEEEVDDMVDNGLTMA